MKNLLTLTDLTKTDISNIIQVAEQMRRIVTAHSKKGPQLIGHTVAGVWDKHGITSSAFQLAAAYLSGTVCPVFGVDNVMEQCRAFDSMGVNTVAVSCEDDNTIRSFASISRASVINSGSSHCDPIGVLADLMALKYKLDGLTNLNVLLVGNRDVNKVDELNYCLKLLGSNAVWYLPAEDYATIRKGIVMDNASVAFGGVDAIIDLGLEPTSNPVKYYGAKDGISEKFMDMARINCLLLGSRNIVDSVGVKEYAHNIVNIRESCYISTAMAVLYLLQRD